MPFQSAPGCTQNTQNPPAFGPSVGVGGGFEDIEYGPGGCEKLLADLQAAGVVLSVEGDRLAFDAPEGVLTDDLLERMRAHREELLAMVEAGAVGPSSVDPAPGGSSVASSILCPWCRSADLVDEPEGIRCRGCDRLAWLDLPAGGWVRADRAELDLVEVDPDAVPVCSGCSRLCDVDRGPMAGSCDKLGHWACSRCDPEADRRRCQTSRVLALKNRPRRRAR